jgi:hypothetical protein
MDEGDSSGAGAIPESIKRAYYKNRWYNALDPSGGLTAGCDGIWAERDCSVGAGGTMSLS